MLGLIQFISLISVLSILYSIIYFSTPSCRQNVTKLVLKSLNRTFLGVSHHTEEKKADLSKRVIEPHRQNKHIVSVSDSTFQKKYKAQMETVECYAEKHDISFHYLNVENIKNCSNIRGFFFKKHCRVSHFLETVPDDDIVFVFDGDVIVKSDDLNMKLSIHEFQNDIVFYQRCWSKEIAAGNYIVKNSPQVRQFLHQWSMWFSRQPSGFSSADNGAIHLQILKSLYGTSSGKYLKCLEMYNNLASSVNNLTSYWNFVACARKSIPFNTSISRIGGLKISLLHPKHSWIHDNVCNKIYVDKSPFIHGIKKEYDIKKHFYGRVYCEQRSWRGVF